MTLEQVNLEIFYTKKLLTNLYYKLDNKRYGQHGKCRDSNRQRKGKKQIIYHSIFNEINKNKEYLLDLIYEKNCIISELNKKGEKNGDI